MKTLLLLLLLISGPVLACPGCWKAGKPWPAPQDPGGMQLESLRKHFAGSRFDQPVRVEISPNDTTTPAPDPRRNEHPPARSQEVPVSSKPGPK